MASIGDTRRVELRQRVTKLIETSLVRSESLIGDAFGLMRSSRFHGGFNVVSLRYTELMLAVTLMSVTSVFLWVLLVEENGTFRDRVCLPPGPLAESAWNMLVLYYNILFVAYIFLLQVATSRIDLTTLSLTPNPLWLFTTIRRLNRKYKGNRHEIVRHLFSLSIYDKLINIISKTSIAALLMLYLIISLSNYKCYSALIMTLVAGVSLTFPLIVLMTLILEPPPLQLRRIIIEAQSSSLTARIAMKTRNYIYVVPAVIILLLLYLSSLFGKTVDRYLVLATMLVVLVPYFASQLFSSTTRALVGRRRAFYRVAVLFLMFALFYFIITKVYSIYVIPMVILGDPSPAPLHSMQSSTIPVMLVMSAISALVTDLAGGTISLELGEGDIGEMRIAYVRALRSSLELGSSPGLGSDLMLNLAILLHCQACYEASMLAKDPPDSGPRMPRMHSEVVFVSDSDLALISDRILDHIVQQWKTGRIPPIVFAALLANAILVAKIRMLKTRYGLPVSDSNALHVSVVRLWLAWTILNYGLSPAFSLMLMKKLASISVELAPEVSEAASALGMERISSEIRNLERVLGVEEAGSKAAEELVVEIRRLVEVYAI